MSAPAVATHPCWQCGQPAPWLFAYCDACQALHLAERSANCNAGLCGRWGFGMHCRTCHSDRHRACDVCGACMPGWGQRIPGRQRGGRRTRRYCSPACRQRAYRQRQATA